MLVNAAVPASLIADEVPMWFGEALKETKEAALAYLQRRKIAVDSSSVRSFIDDLRDGRA